MAQSSKIKADLIPHSEEYDQTVRSWIESEETYQLVCRGKEYPPPENVIRTWQREGVNSYLLFADRKPIAYGELWKRSGELSIEVAHVLVSPVMRSAGFGTKMVELLLNRASTKSDTTRVMANIYDENNIAVECFMKAGFELAGTTDFTVGLRLIKMIV